MESFESFHLDQWVKSYEDIKFAGKYGIERLHTYPKT